MPETRASKATRLAGTQGSQAGPGGSQRRDRAPSADPQRPAPLGSLSVLGQDAQTVLVTALIRRGVLKTFRLVNKAARDFVDQNVTDLGFVLRVADYAPAAAAPAYAAGAQCGGRGTGSATGRSGAAAAAAAAALAAGREARAARRRLLAGGWRQLLNRCPFATSVTVNIQVHTRPPRPELSRSLSRGSRHGSGAAAAAAVAAAAAAAAAAASTAVASTLAAALMPPGQPHSGGAGAAAGGVTTTSSFILSPSNLAAGRRVTSLTFKLTPVEPDGGYVNDSALAAAPPPPRTAVLLTPEFAAAVATSFPQLKDLSFIGLWRLPPPPPPRVLPPLWQPAGDAAGGVAQPAHPQPQELEPEEQEDEAAAAAAPPASPPPPLPPPPPRDQQREVYAALARLQQLRRLHMGTYDGLQHIRLLAAPPPPPPPQMPSGSTAAAAQLPQPQPPQPQPPQPPQPPPLEELELGDQYDVDSRGADLALAPAAAAALAALPYLRRLRLYEQARTCISLGVLLSDGMPPGLRVLELGAPLDHWPLLGECWCRLDRVVVGQGEQQAEEADGDGEDEGEEEEVGDGADGQEGEGAEAQQQQGQGQGQAARQRGRRPAAGQGAWSGAGSACVWDMQWNYHTGIVLASTCAALARAGAALRRVRCPCLLLRHESPLPVELTAPLEAVLGGAAAIRVTHVHLIASASAAAAAAAAAAANAENGGGGGGGGGGALPGTDAVSLAAALNRAAALLGPPSTLHFHAPCSGPQLRRLFGLREEDEEAEEAEGADAAAAAAAAAGANGGGAAIGAAAGGAIGAGAAGAGGAGAAAAVAAGAAAVAAGAAAVAAGADAAGGQAAAPHDDEGAMGAAARAGITDVRFYQVPGLTASALVGILGRLPSVTRVVAWARGCPGLSTAGHCRELVRRLAAAPPELRARPLRLELQAASGQLHEAWGLGARPGWAGGTARIRGGGAERARQAAAGGGNGGGGASGGGGGAASGGGKGDAGATGRGGGGGLAAGAGAGAGAGPAEAGEGAAVLRRLNRGLQRGGVAARFQATPLILDWR